MEYGTSDHAADCLARYYTAGKAELADIEAELVRLALPQIRAWIRRFQDLSLDDAEERQSEVTLRLVLALRAGRDDPGRRVRSLFALAKTITQRLAIDSIRARHPRRAVVLKIRYLCAAPRWRGALARWEAPSRGWLVGLAGWQDRTEAAEERLRRLDDHPQEFIASSLGGRDPRGDRVPTPELIIRILQWLRGPCGEARLADLVVALQGLEPPRGISLESLAERGDRAVEGLVAADPTSREPDRDWSACWAIVRALPDKARFTVVARWTREMLALLVGEPDPRPELASVLGLEAHEMGRLWRELPLDNTEIARRLDTTPNNVYVMYHRSLARVRDAAC